MTSTNKAETAAYSGILDLGDGLTIRCGVMKDGTRLLSEREVAKIFDSHRGGSHWRRKKKEGTNLPVYASATNLQPFIPYDLADKLTHPRLWRQNGRGGTGARGIDASCLPGICKVFLAARKEGQLLPSQEHIAERAEVLVTALAEVGIDALVDEATGYQEVRRRDELQKLLSKYISAELQPWTKRFPDEFYRQMFRLRGWDFDNLGAHGHKPRVAGKLTNDIVYKRMPKGVLDELRKKNPPTANGRRKWHHHQFLTPDIGDTHLEQQITADIALMKASSNWKQFMRMLDRAYPKYGAVQDELDIDID